MTVQEVKAALNAVHTAFREYELSQEKMLRFRSALTGAAQVMSDMPQQNTHSENSRERGLLKLLEYSAETDRKFDYYLTVRGDAEQMIDRLDDRYEREVLTRKYTMFQKWEEISEKMNISLRHIYRLHGEALVKISENCKDVTKCH